MFGWPRTCVRRIRRMRGVGLERRGIDRYGLAFEPSHGGESLSDPGKTARTRPASTR